MASYADEASYANERRAEREHETDDMNELFKLFSTSGYDFKENKWTRAVDESKKGHVCSGIISALTKSGYNPLEYANMLYQAGIANDDTQKQNQAVLIIRCHYRTIKNSRKSKTGESEDCGVGDMIAALKAMGLSDNKEAMDDSVDDIMFPDGASYGAASYGGGAIQQSGGSPHDLATLLFLKRHLVDKLVEVGPRYAGQLISWIDGQLGQLDRLKRCVLDILGINPATFYDDITSYMGGLYNKGAIAASGATATLSVWINANRAMAFGLTAFVLRYQNNIVGAGRAVGSVLPDIFNALATTGSNVQTVITHFWQSDIGVALLLSLYYYDQHPDEVNVAVVSGFAAIKSTATGAADMYMAALARFEAFSNRQIADYAQVKINDDLINMMAILEKSLAATDDAGHLAELARILDKTAQIQINIVNTVAATARTRSQTARIAAAKATLTAVQDQLIGANRDYLLAEIEKMNASKGARKGGKSHSRKLHKKVSKSKRPKRSVHSRKAKGVKRSNKKH
jgi:hypothetical protein